MKHLDLFSGIGGFAYAVDQVWENAEHTFVENDKFCQKILKKHWPNSKIHGDIRQFITHTESSYDRGNTGELSQENEQQTKERQEKWLSKPRSSDCFLLTGGFPCQPFSQAGRRKGTQDDRYLWPEMFRVIQLTKPTWVIAENVRGLITWNEGMVLEQACTDLENEGYEVQPFIIPAVAVNAPHRRDRVWIIAHAESVGSERRPGEVREKNGRQNGKLHTEFNGADSYAPDTDNARIGTPGSGIDRKRSQKIQERELALNGTGRQNSNAQNPVGERSRWRMESERQVLERQSTETENERPSWEENWLEVATELCRVDDGLPDGLDFAGYSKAGHRNQRLKGLGNAIVPAVAVEIMRAFFKANQ